MIRFSYVAIEGIIGAGKTTLANKLHLYSQASNVPSWRLLKEPVEENPVLGKFYEDPKRWAFAMQIFLLHHRYRLQQVAAFETTPCILDRSLPGDRVFAQLHRKYGNISDLEWEIYEHCFDAMVAIRPPALLIYLDVYPEVALERIKERARGEETGITIDYLEDLREGYSDLMEDIQSGRHAWSRGLEIMRFGEFFDADVIWSAIMSRRGRKVMDYVHKVETPRGQMAQALCGIPLFSSNKQTQWTRTGNPPVTCPVCLSLLRRTYETEE